MPAKINYSYVKIKLERAFTLIELLIVISIIGVLSTFAVFNFQSAGAKARDAQRKSDLKQYHEALVNYSVKNSGFYPKYSVAAEIKTLCSALSLNACPEDPKPYKDGANYYFVSEVDNSGDPGATKFVLYGSLEFENGNPFWVVCSGGVSGTVANTPASGDCPI